jgi:hypothetical protein
MKLLVLQSVRQKRLKYIAKVTFWIGLFAACGEASVGPRHFMFPQCSESNEMRHYGALPCFSSLVIIASR